jgi:hypothetical protein
MTIYIATTEDGRYGIAAITALSGVEELRAYADEVLASTDSDVPARATIGECCDLLEDRGPSFGSRTHYMVSRVEAIRAMRAGAKAHGYADMYAGID